MASDEVKKIAIKHKKFIEKVHEAFNRHCDEIHAHTEEQLKAISEDDTEKRKEILMKQKENLDKTLAELKELLNRKTRETRERIEILEKKKEQKTFSLDAVLKTV